MTGHRSDELERYKHLSPEFKQQTTELIAEKLVDELEGRNGMGTFLGTSPENEKSRQEAASQTADNKEDSGGADGARTRDLQRDRLAF